MNSQSVITKPDSNASNNKSPNCKIPNIDITNQSAIIGELYSLQEKKRELIKKINEANEALQVFNRDIVVNKKGIVNSEFQKTGMDIGDQAFYKYIEGTQSLIDEYTCRQEYLYNLLKYKLPKQSPQSITDIVSGQTFIDENGMAEGIDERTYEVGFSIYDPATKVFTLIAATAGVAIMGATLGATIMHTGGAALIGLAIFVGTTIYNSTVIDEYMKYIYNLQSTISMSYNRMRIHTVAINKMLEEAKITHRIFGPDDSPCYELTEFLSISMYFYQVFFLYINDTVSDSIPELSKSEQEKIEKEKKQLKREIDMNNNEYEKMGISTTSIEKATEYIRKKNIERKARQQNRKSKLIKLFKYTYRALSINTIKKNLDIILNSLLLMYTNLLSKYTEDYTLALLYLVSKGVSVSDIDMSIFFQGIGIIQASQAKITEANEITASPHTGSYSNLAAAIELNVEADVEEDIIQDIQEDIQEKKQEGNNKTPDQSASIPESLPTSSVSVSKQLLTPEMRTKILRENVAAPKTNWFLNLFRNRNNRVGGNYIKQKTQLLKNKMLKCKNNHITKLKNDFSKIEKLYGKILPSNNKSRKIKQRSKTISKQRNKTMSKQKNKTRSKTYSKTYY